MRLLSFVAPGLALGAMLASAGHAQTPHPLDPLTTAEYATVLEVLKSGGKTDSTARFPIITLAAPAKAAVNGWREGGALPARTAAAVVKQGPRVFEAVVDVGARRLVSWREMPGKESPVLFEEWGAAQEATLAHPEMVAALARRGITDRSKLFCAPLTMGYFDIAADRGMRLLKVGCFDLRPTENNVFGWPIEGLFAIVDLNRNRAVRIHDSGPVPIAAGNHNFTEKAVGELREPLRPFVTTRPATTSPSTGTWSGGRTGAFTTGSIAARVRSSRW